MLIVSSFSFASSGTSMLIAKQEKSPASLVEATFGMYNLVESAKLANHNGKAIAAYKIGWVYVVSGKATVNYGEWVVVFPADASKKVLQVPAQAVAPKHDAEKVVFFVAGLKYADGTLWNSDEKVIVKDATTIRRAKP